MRNFEKFVETRDTRVGGLAPWYWLKEESGAWTGPKSDWEDSHVKIIDAMPNRRTVVQAGGNQGMYPRLLSERFERVYTFEPDYANFFVLSKNCQRDNIFKFQAFLGDHPDHFDIRRPQKQNTGMHEVQETDGPILTMTLDSFRFKNLDLIWLDIEGYEIKALKGAYNTLVTHRPLVLLENGQRDDIKLFMIDLGYKIDGTTRSDTVWRPQ